jgi:hypothetical protein
MGFEGGGFAAALKILFYREGGGGIRKVKSASRGIAQCVGCN